MSVSMMVDGTEIVNMSNRKAFIVLSALGVDIESEGWVWAASAGEIADRCLVARAGLAIEGDAGFATTENRDGDEWPGGAVLVDCGLLVGYVGEKLSLIEDACRAAHFDAEVVFA